MNAPDRMRLARRRADEIFAIAEAFRGGAWEGQAVWAQAVIDYEDALAEARDVAERLWQGKYVGRTTLLGAIGKPDPLDTLGEPEGTT